jgi:ABC-2 type transport system permease protein
MKFRRFYAIFRKEGLHIVRDWRSLALALAIPAMLLLLFGYALTLDVDKIPTAVYDQDRTPQSRTLIAHFQGSRYFHILDLNATYSSIEKDVNKSKIIAGLVIPKNFGRTILSSGTAKVQLILDGSDSNTASIAMGYASALIATYAGEVRDRELSLRGMPKVKIPVDVRVRMLYNPELKSKNFIIPGLISVILMLVAAMLTSLTIAREWESGTMEQLLSTPVRPIELLMGKLCAYFVLGLADMVLALILGIGVFRVPLHGSALLLAVSSMLYLFGALCWGILISTVARTQQVAFQVSLLTSFLPSFLLSGFIYSLDNMPWVIQQISRIFPARYFVAILQGVFLKGIGLPLLWANLLFLLIYAVVVFAIANKKLRPKIA